VGEEAAGDEAAVGDEAAAVGGGPAAAVSRGPGAAEGEAAVAVFRGRAEEAFPDRGEVTSPGHPALRETLIVPVRGLPQTSTEEMAVELLPETRFRATDLPGNAWPTARLNYLHPHVLTVRNAHLAAVLARDPRPSPLGPVPVKVLPTDPVPVKVLPTGQATGRWAISSISTPKLVADV
jgi:hypothetical protein